ncbi:TonB-dependent receptor domain-containing protein [Cupriavidus basilensis]
MVNPTYSNSPATAPSAVGNRQSASANTLAAYANDSIEFSKQWKLVAGLRYDRYLASITNSVNSTNTKGNTALSNAEQTVNFTSVRVGGLWQPTEAQSYYSCRTALRSIRRWNNWSAPWARRTWTRKRTSYEAGGKWDLMGGDLSLTSALFQITKDNARSQIDATTYALTGKIRVRGFRAGATGRITSKWQVFAGYTYLDGEIVNGIAAGTRGHGPDQYAQAHRDGVDQLPRVAGLGSGRRRLSICRSVMPTTPTPCRWAASCAGTA